MFPIGLLGWGGFGFFFFFFFFIFFPLVCVCVWRGRGDGRRNGFSMKRGKGSLWNQFSVAPNKCALRVSATTEIQLCKPISLLK